MDSYMATWLGWTAGTVSDGEIITRMHVDPFFKRWFEKRRKALFDARAQQSANRSAG
ncbi:hypothetical protein [Chthonobacter albigriseus]|uniref:hypothetical protein n=1 Tax=Chthonobacter albigriseus TaxID=1683161 RepID=UPI0015EE8CC9|nr:hypothetical protein [Chthonobacter albigriseus]